MWRILIISVIVLVGCKSRQKLGNQYPNCKYAMTAKKDLEKTADSLSLSFKWMKLKTKVDAVTNNDKLNFVLQFRILNDSLVYAKVSKAGITGAKLLATRDTVIFVDKINKQYLTGSYNDLEKLINIKVPFEFIQNLFLSEPTFLYENEGFKKVVEPLIAYSNSSFEEGNNEEGFTQIQSFTCDSLRLKNVEVFDGNSGKEIHVNYNKFGDINGHTLNKKIELKANQGDKQLILADIEIKRIKLFESLTAPIDVPNDYKKMEIK